MQETGLRAAPLASPLSSPLHAILLAFPVALYPSALISDITFLNSAVVQWTNFSQWLIAGADVFAGILLAWALVSFFFGKARGAKSRSALYLIVIAAMFVLGVLNAFKHSQDGWASVGTTGVVLSLLCSVLALVAAFLAHSSAVVREPRP